MRLNIQIQITKSSGQVTMEYLLLAVVLIVMFQVFSKSMKGNQALKNFQEAPNKILKNMVENGNWEVDEEQSKRHHSNQHDSHYSNEGDKP